MQPFAVEIKDPDAGLLAATLTARPVAGADTVVVVCVPPVVVVVVVVVFEETTMEFTNALVLGPK